MLEAHLATDGLYADVNQPLHGEGLIVLDTHCGQPEIRFGTVCGGEPPCPYREVRQLAIDSYVGSRVRLRRTLLGISLKKRRGDRGHGSSDPEV